MAMGDTSKTLTIDLSEGAVDDILTRAQGQGIFDMLVQLTGTVARVEQRVESLDQGVERLDQRIDRLEGVVAGVAADVRDLVYWKHKLWGMVILMGWLAAGCAGVWAFIGSHVSWTSAPANAMPALSAAPAETPTQVR
ncbi:hypothetical protein BJI69_21650 [Luteibacter rhizovicinus DSM 16549]|uniref:Uncharacterized protein n=1 Tax=Luteibacter rhizovicinus DSM 16549 TaxID=1440763 RepID=A0A0G9H8B7_9GAMM|nr:hypothetical protein [Luteibacter rhizovicinus]APG06251.1 hypothetical protein BJI69_21650 [Luteibacter rhizovicinus DSM 16549]KLD65671.1 hypothetical protein Y883_15985 [Luteibacter rhizovicinus DSM 16549]